MFSFLLESFVENLDKFKNLIKSILVMDNLTSRVDTAFKYACSRWRERMDYLEHRGLDSDRKEGHQILYVIRFPFDLVKGYFSPSSDSKS